MVPFAPGVGVLAPEFLKDHSNLSWPWPFRWKVIFFLKWGMKYFCCKTKRVIMKMSIEIGQSVDHRLNRLYNVVTFSFQIFIEQCHNAMDWRNRGWSYTDCWCAVGTYYLVSSMDIYRYLIFHDPLSYDLNKCQDPQSSV